MYAEVCAYLTNNKYYELVNYCKTQVNFTAILCSTILIGMCSVGMRLIQRFDWKCNCNDEDETEKHLSDETISTATALLSTTPRNSIMHSSQHSTSTVRHRVHFKS